MLNLSPKSKSSVVNILSETFLFRQTDTQLMTDFVGQCTLCEYSSGDIIINADKFRRGLAVVLSGKIAVRRHDTLLKLMAKGDIFGAASLFGGEKDDYFTSVEAKTKAKILFIGQKQIEALFEENPQTAKNYICFLSDKIRFLNNKIDSFTSDSGYAKIAKYLLSFKSDKLTIPQSFSKLSEELNIGRATLYRAFDRLSEDCVITRCSKAVTILNMDKLKALAD